VIALLLPHTGAHVAPHAAMLPVLPAIFRRAVAAVRRKQAAPETPRPSGAATVLLANRNAKALGSSFRVSLTPEEESAALAELGQGVLGDRTISEVRADADARKRAARHADAMNAGYASAVDRLRQEAGLPTVKQMRQLRAGSPPFLFPPLEEPLWAEPEPRGPVRDTRMDVYAPHYAPDTAPGYGQTCTANVLAAEQAGRLAS
jgi:hypothetical protein